MTARRPDLTDVGTRVPWKVLAVVLPLLLLGALAITDASGARWALAAVLALVAIFALSAWADRQSDALRDRILARDQG